VAFQADCASPRFDADLADVEAQSLFSDLLDDDEDFALDT
jgi:hypothetical protein